ncbi:hypothetical protein [Archangium primigenium]|uniref:hypothetical protein n=1 Tax=[Archangium] primigenium TaxID=2792470 RepID=UPI00195AF427|nr:hypothetical protein [Archangium primigenium]MBM7118837.1 hypothetical protein [Archangium primigenium]
MRTVFVLALVAVGSVGCSAARRYDTAVSSGVPLDVERLSISLSGDTVPSEREDRPMASLVTNLVHRPFVGGIYVPADRISWAEVRIGLLSDTFKLIGYASREFDETSFVASLAPDGQALTFVREGLGGTDVSGGTAIDVRLAAVAPKSTQVHVFTEAQDAKGRITLGTESLRYPACNRLGLSVRAIAVIRHVDPKNARTIDEGDDAVTYEWHQASGAPVAHELELAPTVLYRLRTARGEVLKVNAGGRPVELALGSDAEAHALQAWLAANRDKLGALQDEKLPFVDDQGKPLTFTADPGFGIEAVALNDVPCASAPAP